MTTRPAGAAPNRSGVGERVPGVRRRAKRTSRRARDVECDVVHDSHGFRTSRRPGRVEMYVPQGPLPAPPPLTFAGADADATRLAAEAHDHAEERGDRVAIAPDGRAVAVRVGLVAQEAVER